MVVKPSSTTGKSKCGFESRVILDGSQTALDQSTIVRLFESRVILDGSQTFRTCCSKAQRLRVVLF